MTIYLDSSVALAELLSEDRRSPSALWDQDLTSSRLLEYEIWNRLHNRGLGRSHAAEAAALLQKIVLVDLTPHVLRRALRPFPVSVRTLDGLHLATAEYLTGEGESIDVATFDARMIVAARSLGLPICEL